MLRVDEKKKMRWMESMSADDVVKTTEARVLH